MPKAAKKKTPAKISGKKPRPHWRKDWKKAEKAWDDGLDVRRAMFGPAGAENQIADTSDFMWPMQDYVTRRCFGETWTRPHLNRKTRSLITLGDAGRARPPARDRRACARRGQQRRQQGRALRADDALDHLLRHPEGGRRLPHRAGRAQGHGPR